jgi:hypothetical protein
MAGGGTSPEAKAPEWSRAFLFFREDARWVRKLSIGAGFTGLSVLALGCPFVAGYLLRVLRTTARESGSTALPEWADWWQLLRDGASAIAVYVTWLLPFVLAALGVSWAMAAFERQLGADSLAYTLIVLVVGFGGGAVAVLALALLYLYLPAAFVRIAVTRRWVDAFALRANVAFIRRNLAGYFRGLALFLGAGGLAQAGLLLCGVGAFATAFWALLVGAWSFGQVAQRDRMVASLLESR